VSRHTCTFCGAKRNEAEMALVRHRLFGQKTAWVCSSHVSEFSDIFDVRSPQPKPLFLELFSGSGHIAAASMRGFETLTVDVEPSFRPDICADICADIFTNCPHFTPIEATGRPAALNGGVAALNGAYERALVPPKLIGYLLDCLGFLLPEPASGADKNFSDTTLAQLG
jgi:hypothetical protein